jgi:transposase InsO family protein
VKRLQTFCDPHQPSSTRRGYARQRLTREREHTLRAHIAELTHWTTGLGLSLPQTAGLLNLAPRTLYHWCDDFCVDMPHIHLLGRPTLRSPRADRMNVLAVLDELGPATSVATLRDCFPAMPRAELDDLLKRYRAVWRKRHLHAPHFLTWPVPGTVWAMDFSEAPRLIDGLYPYLFAVRDLASSNQLLWLPVRSLSADEAIQGLRSMFVNHGTPLVMKTDNGPAFIAEAMHEFFWQFAVNSLFSPPYTPRYNGAIEAGIGSLKMRTERHATLHGHPGYWTLDDVEAARQEANATARPQGPIGPTPDELWDERRPITPEQRRAFQDSVKRQRAEVNVKEGRYPNVEVSSAEERRLQREAIRRALGEHGYLLFSRRRIPLPITKQKSANIT